MDTICQRSESNRFSTKKIYTVHVRILDILSLYSFRPSIRLSTKCPKNCMDSANIFFKFTKFGTVVLILNNSRPIVKLIEQEC